VITNQALTNQSKPGSGQEQPNKQRRTLIGGALVALLSSSRRMMAQGSPAPNDPFILLLKGVYQPVANAPNLGLSVVNLNDGSYSVTQIYAASTIPGIANHTNAAVGKFYAQFNGDLAAYDLPGGAIAMRFTDQSSTTEVSDGQGGVYLELTYELTILEANGIYRPFVGGHNHMVDRLHLLADGNFDESCFCIISLPSLLPLWWSSN